MALLKVQFACETKYSFRGGLNMKGGGFIPNRDILAKIEKIKKEERSVHSENSRFEEGYANRQKNISKKGILKALKISDAEIARAQKSLYSEISGSRKSSPPTAAST
jgi:hypothetical protein